MEDTQQENAKEDDASDIVFPSDIGTEDLPGDIPSPAFYNVEFLSLHLWMWALILIITAAFVWWRKHGREKKQLQMSQEKARAAEHVAKTTSSIDSATKDAQALLAGEATGLPPIPT